MGDNAHLQRLLEGAAAVVHHHRHLLHHEPLRRGRRDDVARLHARRHPLRLTRRHNSHRQCGLMSTLAPAQMQPTALQSTRYHIATFIEASCRHCSTSSASACVRSDTKPIGPREAPSSPRGGFSTTERTGA